MIQKIKTLVKSIIGYIYKLMIDLGILKIPKLAGGCDIIVSLTSYGRRVKKNIVYYTLVSLLRQKVQPKRIILMLAHDEWNDDNLPERLDEMRKKGVEIRYCEDTRSFKKLVPTLELCPGEVIMTVDDDMIYNTKMIAQMASAHSLYPRDILCMDTLSVELENGIPAHYNRWPVRKEPDNGKMIFPVGVGGTLYPNGSLHPDVLKKDLFMRLCPLADDIWFWFQGLRQGTIKRYVKKMGNDYSFDALYQYFHKGSALTHSNSLRHANDRQFKDLFSFYGVRVDNKGNIIES